MEGKADPGQGVGGEGAGTGRSGCASPRRGDLVAFTAGPGGGVMGKLSRLSKESKVADDCEFSTLWDDLERNTQQQGSRAKAGT